MLDPLTRLGTEPTPLQQPEPEPQQSDSQPTAPQQELLDGTVLSHYVLGDVLGSKRELQ